MRRVCREGRRGVRARDTRKRGGIVERLGAAPAAVVSEVKNGVPAAIIIADENVLSEGVRRKRPAHAEGENERRCSTYSMFGDGRATSNGDPMLSRM